MTFLVKRENSLITLHLPKIQFLFFVVLFQNDSSFSTNFPFSSIIKFFLKKFKIYSPPAGGVKCGGGGGAGCVKCEEKILKYPPAFTSSPPQLLPSATGGRARLPVLPLAQRYLRLLSGLLTGLLTRLLFAASANHLSILTFTFWSSRTVFTAALATALYFNKSFLANTFTPISIFDKVFRTFPGTFPFIEEQSRSTAGAGQHVFSTLALGILSSAEFVAGLAGAFNLGIPLPALIADDPIGLFSTFCLNTTFFGTIQLK